MKRDFDLSLVVLIFLVSVKCNSPDEPRDPNAFSPKHIAIGSITRLPKIPAPEEIQSDRWNGWPAANSPIEWVATVVNNNPNPNTQFSFCWLVNGDTVSKGTSVSTEKNTLISLPGTWTQDRSDIELVIKFYTKGRPEVKKMLIYSDALSLGLWIDEDIYDWFANSTEMISFEEWSYTEISKWNDVLRASNCVDRIRLDKISIVSKNVKTKAEFQEQIDTDLEWWYTDKIADQRFIHVNSPPPVLNNQMITFHELLHQRGLLDLYAFDVQHGSTNGSLCQIKDFDGTQAAGSVRMRLKGHFLYFSPYSNSLMGKDYSISAILSPACRHGLNLLHHYRTPRQKDSRFFSGFAESTRYIADLPREIRIQIRNLEGINLANYNIDLFFDKEAGPNKIYTDVYNADPDLTLRTDKGGWINVTNELWQNQNFAKRFSASTLILRASEPDKSKWGYAFLPTNVLTNLFVENQDVGFHVLQVDIQ